MEKGKGISLSLRPSFSVDISLTYYLLVEAYGYELIFQNAVEGTVYANFLGLEKNRLAEITKKNWTWVYQESFIRLIRWERKN